MYFVTPNLSLEKRLYLGSLVRKWRVEEGARAGYPPGRPLPLPHAAKLLGCSRAYLWNIEHGKATPADRDVLSALHKYARIHPAEWWEVAAA